MGALLMQRVRVIFCQRSLMVTGLLILSLVMLLTACERLPQDVIRFGVVSMPVTLDTRFATDATSSRVNRLLYQALARFDDATEPAPELARWQQIAPQQYRFHLQKEGRQFSNGLYLTADDVKATYVSILDEKTGSPHRNSLTVIDHMVIVDKDTIDFFLNKVDPLFPGRLTIGILPKTLIASDHAFNRQPIGSGAFSVSRWPDDGYLELIRHRDQQKFAFVHVADPTVRALKLLRGEIDMLQNDLPPELVTMLDDDVSILVQRGIGSNFAYLGFNMDDELLSNLKVRQAIAHAIDRDAVIKYMLGGGAVPASALLPPDHWAGNPQLGAYDYNPEKSRALLRQAGYKEGEPIPLVYKTSSDPFRVRLATIFQQQLAAVGFKVDLRSYDWGTFYGDIKAGNFQMYSLMWVGIKMPDIYRYVFHSDSIPPKGANRGRFRDARADVLIDKAEASETLSEQSLYYQQLQTLLLDELPYVPLWFENHVYAANKNIRHYMISRDGNYDGLLLVERVH